MCLQELRKEVALAEAAEIRFSPGSALPPSRDAAELKYAQKMASIGHQYSDAAVLAIAAEGFINMSPWDYYQVKWV